MIPTMPIPALFHLLFPSSLHRRRGVSSPLFIDSCQKQEQSRDWQSYETISRRIRCPPPKAPLRLLRVVVSVKEESTMDMGGRNLRNSSPLRSANSLVNTLQPFTHDVRMIGNPLFRHDRRILFRVSGNIFHLGNQEIQLSHRKIEVLAELIDFW